jgi:hypothetical protein
VFLLAAAAALGAAACGHKVVRGGRLSPEGVERLLAEVERIRGLKATRPLRVSLEGVGKLRSRSAADLRRVSFLQSMEDLSLAWAKVGLVPPGTDLAGAFTAVGTEAPAGYYDTGDQVLRVVDRFNPRSEVTELTGLLRGRDLTDGEVLAHEVTHALQDMHFGLEAFLSGAPNDDAALARRCLVEGDASAVGYAYSSVFTPSLESWIGFLEGRQSALDVKDAPDFLNRRFQLPYLAGARLVGLMRKKGGWAAVNAAYRDPPASTEEVLHPERFLGGRDRPVEVRLPDVKPFLPEGARELWSDSVGELGLRTVLARERPGWARGERPTPGEAAEGWDGDRAVVLQQGGALVLAWKLAFDDDEEAGQGYAAYRRMAGRYPGFRASRETPTRLEGRTGQVGVWLERRGVLVVVLEGFPLDRQGRAAEALFNHPLGNAFDPPGTALADGGAVDGGPADGVVVDSAVVDGGVVDGGVVDGGVVDGGLVEAGGGP